MDLKKDFKKPFVLILGVSTVFICLLVIGFVIQKNLAVPEVQASPATCAVGDDVEITGYLNVSDVYKKGGVAGISSACPANQTFSGLTVSGGIVTSAGGCAAIGGGGYWTQSGSSLYPNDTAWNIGIGTMSPNDKLEVKDGSIRITADGGRLKLYNVSAPSRKWEIINGYASATDGLLTFYDRVASAARMVIDPSGNVGIGTTSVDPDYKITTSGGGIKAEANIASQPAGYFSNSNANGYALVTGSGNVGIGTTPDYKLDVFGRRVRFRADSTVSNVVDLILTPASSGIASRARINFTDQDGTTKGLIDYLNWPGQATFGFTAMTDTSLSFFGGTNTNNFPIRFEQTWNSAGVSFTGVRINIFDTASSASSLLFDVQKDSASQFVIRKDGNVGIGITIPAAKLDVRGNTRIGSIAASANKALCWRTDNTIGYCSTGVDATGGCTCNPIN